MVLDGAGIMSSWEKMLLFCLIWRMNASVYYLFSCEIYFLFTLFLIADIYFNKCPALNMDASQNII